MQVLTLGRRPYAETETAMRDFTHAREGRAPGDDVEDQLWLVEHGPVFTQGLAGRDEHVLAGGDIPVQRTDRGGQVTYHGPGQVVAYPLVNLHRLGIYVKEYVFRIEEAVLETLAAYGVTGHRVAAAPGIYVRPDDPFSHRRLAAAPAGDGNDDAQRFAGLAKIAALGIKVTRGRSYHGVALNVAMDLEPFGRINPCGYPGLVTTDLRALGVQVSWQEAAQRLAAALQRRLV